jgi:serine/threonine protein kinase
MRILRTIPSSKFSMMNQNIQRIFLRVRFNPFIDLNNIDAISPDAISLIKAMLQKKPSMRPTLSELLAHPFLAEHAGQQRAILALQSPPAFTTRLEKDCLQRMKAAGVDIDKVIENVLAKKCDALAGWWALLIEREERKEKRRQKKKIESRRMSAASNLDSLPPPVEEVDEEPPRRSSTGKRVDNNRRWFVRMIFHSLILF